jgi:hypothetical protein
MARVHAGPFLAHEHRVLDCRADGEEQTVAGDPHVGERNEDAAVLGVLNAAGQRGNGRRRAQRCRLRVPVEPGPAGHTEVLGRPRLVEDRQRSRALVGQPLPRDRTALLIEDERWNVDTAAAHEPVALHDRRNINHPDPPLPMRTPEG